MVYLFVFKFDSSVVTLEQSGKSLDCAMTLLREEQLVIWKHFILKCKKKLWAQFLQMEPFCYHQRVVSSVSTYWWSSTHGQLMRCVGHAASCGLSENWNSHFACFISTFTASFAAPCFLPDTPQWHTIQQLVLWSLTFVCMLRLDPQPLRNCFQECNWSRKCVLPSVVRL
jgi:hypothetical protein